MEIFDCCNVLKMAWKIANGMKWLEENNVQRNVRNLRNKITVFANTN